MTPNSGEVEIKLIGETITLRPTLDCAMTISALHGGYQPVINKLVDVDLVTAIQVAQAGAGVKGADAKTLADKIFRRGVGHINADLIKFVMNLSRGGRSAEEVEANEGVSGNGQS